MHNPTIDEGFAEVSGEGAQRSTSAPTVTDSDLTMHDRDDHDGIIPSTTVPRMGISIAGTNAAGTNAAGTNAAGTNAAGTNAAGTNAAETNAAETNAAETNAAGTNAAGTNAAGTNAAGTNAAGTNAAGTNAAGTNAAETSRDAEKNEPIIVGVTGATGTYLACDLISTLVEEGYSVHVIATRTALQVARYEEKIDLEAWCAQYKPVVHWDDNRNLFAGPASGSWISRGMVICPCSMGTLGKVAHGVLENLLERAADVTLKERRPLIICPRESPLSLIHLENMCQITRAGAQIVPPMLGFYFHPKSIQDMVSAYTSRVLDSLKIPHKPSSGRWPKMV